MTTDVYRRIFVLLLIFLDLHTGRRRLCTEEAFPIRVYIYHRYVTRQLIKCMKEMDRTVCNLLERLSGLR